METAQLFTDGGSQAVRLPKGFRFKGNEVNVNRIGDIVLLMPKTATPLTGIMASLELFTDDFMWNGRHDLPTQERESL